MKKPLVTIIIPLYNGEKTIDRAIKSIIRNDSYIEDIEILIIENGSTDQSFHISKKYSELYPNIYLFQSSKGVSFARNLGIKKARGKWLLFLDADDYLIEYNVKSIVEELRLTETNLCVYNFEKGSNPVMLYTENEIISTTDEINSFIIKSLSEPTKHMTVWGKAFRRTIIQQYNLKFNTDLRVSEDSDFYLRFLLAIHSLTISSRTLYHYSIDTPSTMRTFSSDKLEGYIVSLDESSKVLENVDSTIREAFELYKLAHFNLIMVREVFHFDNTKSFREKIREMIRLYSIPMFSEPIQNLSISSIRNLSLVPLFFLKKHLYNLAALVYIIRVGQNKFKEGRKS